MRGADGRERGIDRLRLYSCGVEIEEAALLQERLAGLGLDLTPERERAAAEVGIERIGIREAEHLGAIGRGAERITHNVALVDHDAFATAREL